MTTASDLPQVLVIDDEMGPRESLRMLLKPNYQVYTAENVEAGLRILREKKPDAVVSDIRMPGTSGIDGLRKIREIDPHVAVIMLTGFGALETAKEALRLGANDYISKPFDAREMREVIGRNVERTRIQRIGVSAAAEIQELNNRLLKELAQKERLASLGQASAEFVHDLGNPLTIVWGYVQLLAKKLEQSEKEDGSTNHTSAKELNIIEQNVRLCRELLTMWQSYGSVEASPHKAISATQIVREVVKGVGPMAAQSAVELRCNICDDPCTLLGDPERNYQRAASFRGKDRLCRCQLHAQRFLCRHPCGRYRLRNYADATGKDFRSVFYDETGQERHRPWTLHHEESRRRSQWFDQSGEHAAAWHHIHDPVATPQ
jgi:DNA-binding response OmpR family regulator